uniref:Galactosylgalactosylxylosylprotein 3-beta-glucuronosyltransferase n=1 Tax=Glossina brevipalpis TaxID=37001 RepID=A0A1A9WI08_9MUSC
MLEKYSTRRHFFILFSIFVFFLFAFYNCAEDNSEDRLMRTTYAEDADNYLPKIYAITPTYARPEQKAELTRLSHVFRLVPNLFWIIVEDSNISTPLVEHLLRRAGLARRSITLHVKTPDAYIPSKKAPYWSQSRGVKQRNLGLSWLRNCTDSEERGIVYFMDDDNTYSVELFGEISKTRPGRVAVWPVGLVGTLMAERPILNINRTKVIGFNAVWRRDRSFPIDMAAFAISKDLLFLHPEAKFSYDVELGFQETEFLKQLTTRQELQPLATRSRDVLVWHTRTEKTKLTGEESLRKVGQRSDQDLEV